MLEMPTRRGLITGLGALFLAAPAIVRASSLMPISSKLLAPEPKVLTWSMKYLVRKLDGGWEILPEGRNDVIARIQIAAVEAAA